MVYEEFEKVGYVFKEKQNGRQEVRLSMEKLVSMFSKVCCKRQSFGEI